MFEGLKKRFFATTTAEAPPLTELAASNPSELYSKWSITQYNPDTLARRKGGLIIYDKMRIDDQVKACLTLKKQAVLASGWDIEPSDANDPEAVEVAEFIEHVFEEMKGTLSNTLLQVLTALDYGYSITELNWKIFDEVSGKSKKKDNKASYVGKIGLADIKSKKPHPFVFDTDKFGNLKPNGLHVKGIEAKKYPPEKFIIYTYQKEFGNWYGCSDLRPAYRGWWSKDNILKFFNIYLEKFGSPTTVGKHKSSDATLIDNFKNLISNIQNKSSLTLPHGFEVEFLEAQRKGSSDHEKAAKMYDRHIARAILIPDRLSEAGEKGAYAQAKIHFDVFLWVVNKLRLDLEDDVVFEQVIRPLVTMNYGADAPMPKLKFRALTDEQKQAFLETFNESVRYGAVKPTFEDENYIRETLSFPEKDEEVYKKEQADKAAEEKARAKAEKEVTDPPQGSGNARGEEKKALADTTREYTPSEKRVDFKRMEKKLDTIENTALDLLRATLEKQRDALTAFISTKMVKGELTTQYVNTGVELKYNGELKREIDEMLVATYVEGDDAARTELPKKFIKGQQGSALVPKKALGYLSAKADFLVRGIREPLLTDTKGILLDAIRTGAAVPKVVKQLQDAYLPYIAEGNVIIDGKQITGYRLEAITRTSMSEAYAYGRRTAGDEAGDYVMGYQFSEIIDDRTADVSQFVDGKIISKDHPSFDDLTYPLHWNDRGTFVFVTRDDLPVTFMSDGEIATALSMKRV